MGGGGCEEDGCCEECPLLCGTGSVSFSVLSFFATALRDETRAGGTTNDAARVAPSKVNAVSVGSLGATAGTRNCRWRSEPSGTTNVVVETDGRGDWARAPSATDTAPGRSGSACAASAAISLVSNPSWRSTLFDGREALCETCANSDTGGDDGGVDAREVVRSGELDCEEVAEAEDDELEPTDRGGWRPDGRTSRAPRSNSSNLKLKFDKGAAVSFGIEALAPAPAPLWNAGGGESGGDSRTPSRRELAPPSVGRAREKNASFILRGGDGGGLVAYGEYGEYGDRGSSRVDAGDAIEFALVAANGSSPASTAAATSAANTSALDRVAAAAAACASCAPPLLPPPPPPPPTIFSPPRRFSR